MKESEIRNSRTLLKYQKLVDQDVRKLLLNRREINKLIGRAREKGYTLVPLKVYFKNGVAKVELSIAKAKKLHDKRASIKKREATREIEKAMKRGRG